MTPEPEAAEQQTPKAALPRWIAIFLVVCLILTFVLLATGGGLYFHYSRLIDAQLEGGPFRDSVNIYGASATLNKGDALTPGEIEDELKLSGYHYKVDGAQLKIEAPDSHVRIAMGGDQVQHIYVNDRETVSWTMGYPLLENLSSGNERRHMVTYGELPPVLVNAVISIEDKHFFHHRGLDVARIIKAAYVDVREHRKEQGASTLTMQLVRGLWLHPEKKWKRKVMEAIMTIHLERRWSKEEIFAAYANMVFIGRQAAYSIHGFAEGSQLYFGKDLHNLSLPDAALLAGMVQRPSYFNPYRSPERAMKRRDVVLGLMRDNKYITDSQYEQAVAAPLNLAGPAEVHAASAAPYFLDLVSDELQSLDQPEDGSKNVYTTIDLNLQRAAAEAIASGMKDVDKLLAAQYSKGAPRAEAALIALDPHTGEVKAIIGGRDYAHSQLNRIFAKRPPGSVFKPFVYAAAIDTGIQGGDKILTPATTVDDNPTTFSYDGRAYRPANFRQEIFGTLTLRQALAKSDNVAAVKVAQMVGYPAVVSMARRMGLNGDIKPTPAVALGSYAVTPFEMAGAWTAFANSGMRVQPQLVLRVQNADGETVHTGHSDARQAIDPRVAFVIGNMLEEVMRTGTAAGVRSRGFTVPAAGKTGTSHDGWFAGYTSQLLCIVWVGFDDYRELGIEGAKSALPIWTAFMKKAGQLEPYRNARAFARPDGIGSAKICMQSGKLAGDFCTKTTNEVFIAGTEPQEKCDIHTAPVQPDPLASYPSASYPGVYSGPRSVWFPGPAPSVPPTTVILPHSFPIGPPIVQ